MKKTILLCMFIVSINAAALKVITHFSNESEGGVSVEQEVIHNDVFKIGVGATWNEINEKDYNRTFPVYVVGKYKLEDNFYSVMRAGITLDEDYNNDSKFLESGIGYEYKAITIEWLASHQRGENQAVLKIGYYLE